MISHIVFDHDGTVVDTHMKCELFDGMSEIIAFLKESEVKIYIWTARDRFSTIQILKDLDILHLFDDISTATDCALKPDPQGLKDMLIGVNPLHVAVIGDSYTDMLGSKKYGALAIGALWDNPESTNEETLRKYGAVHLCKSTGACLELLKKLI